LSLYKGVSPKKGKGEGGKKQTQNSLELKKGSYSTRTENQRRIEGEEKGRKGRITVNHTAATEKLSVLGGGRGR